MRGLERWSFRKVAFVWPVAFASCFWTLRAEPASSAEVARAKGPKTLLESIVGSDPRETEHSQEEDRLEPDRPHYPEATTAVGMGRVMLEAGYTFSKKGNSFTSHAAPEALVRVGALAEWFEFRFAQNAVSQRQTSDGVSANISGLQDLYLGFKAALMKQYGVLPAIAVIPQMTIPTGSNALTAGRVLPGVNVDLSWEVVKDFFSIEVLIANNLVRDGMYSARHELGTGFTAGFQLTKKLEAFVEWDSFYPSKGIGPSGPRHYAVGGLVYFVSNNFAVDVRAGVGLNDNSDDFVAGLGFSARF